MFTGIVTDLGEVLRVEERGEGLRRLRMACSYDPASIALGASIACSGACLTVVEKADGWFAALVSAETLSRTNLGTWRVGTRINLERPLRLGDELGGHMVLGHVDGLACIVGRRPEGDSLRFTFETAADLSRLIAPKGSVALDGVSLTVNEVDGRRFGVNIIPHTQSRTSFGTAAIGDSVNLEIDPLARYVARLLQTAAGEASS
jgi:riboflavin synthase